MRGSSTVRSFGHRSCMDAVWFNLEIVDPMGVMFSAADRNASGSQIWIKGFCTRQGNACSLLPNQVGKKLL